MRPARTTVVSPPFAADGPRTAEVQLFNTDVLGQPTSRPVRLLADTVAGAAEPYVVWADVKDGKYVAGSVFYREPVRVLDVVAALEKVYGRSTSSGGMVWMWWDRGRGFHISMSQKCGDTVTSVSYITFRKTPEEPAKQVVGVKENDFSPAPSAPEN